MSRRLICAVLVLQMVLLALVAGACRTTAGSGGAVAAPTRAAAVTAVAPVGPPAPTKTRVPQTAGPSVSPLQTAAPTSAVGPVAWTLTILHTGEVYGDVLPCG